MAKRKNVGKKTRFEVFKRDRFTCQYCGKTSPDVVLHVDHIDPVNNGGTNEIINLVTSCESCNFGKGKRLLDDRKSVQIQREQLAAVEERREQLKMMLDWRVECAGLDAEQVDAVNTIIQIKFGKVLSPQGRIDVAALIEKFGVNLVMDSTQTACKYYKDANTAVLKIGGICVCKKRDVESPGMGKFSYIRAILKNRGIYVNEGTLKDLMKTAFSIGLTPQVFIEAAKIVRSWTAFRDFIDVQLEPESTWQSSKSSKCHTDFTSGGQT